MEASRAQKYVARDQYLVTFFELLDQITPEGVDTCGNFGMLYKPTQCYCPPPFLFLALHLFELWFCFMQAEP